MSTQPSEPVVERMAGVDAGYLYLETPTMHMHTLKVAVLRPEEAFDVARFTEEMRARLGRLPPLGRMVLPTPGALNHPLWVESEVDLDQHLFWHDVAPGTGTAGMERLVGEVAGRPLDRSRPLWELHAADPYGDGRVVIVAKLHHALADGAAANALLANVIDGAAAAGARSLLAAPPRQPGPPPGRAAQLRMGLVDAVRQVALLPGLLRRTAQGVAAVLRFRRQHPVRVPRPILDVPVLPFNQALTPRRSFATASLPLADLQAVKRQHGVTLNDVVLAVVAGALRGWLVPDGLLPEKAIVAGVPVGTDAPGEEPRLSGNRVSNLFTTLATDVEDPVERLRQIARTTDAAKTVQQTLGPSLLIDWVQFSPPAPLSAFMRAYSRRRGASRHAPPFNLVVSNVRGPGHEVSIAGARVLDFFSVGPILEGIGLNVTAWSYDGRLNLSLLACPDHLPDLAPLVRLLPAALEELLPLPRKDDIA